MTQETTKPFIDLGWHTVSLQGELKRLENGKKTIPIFPKDWKAKSLNMRVTEPAKLGGVLTGRESGVIAIDCDNTIAYSLFKALDPDYKFHFISLGKKDTEGNEQESGTIVYKYTPELPDGFRIASDGLALDFLSNNGMTYLPTLANTTKAPFDMCELKEVPATIVALLKRFYIAKNAVSTNAVNLTSRSRFNLAPLVKQFVHSKGTVTRALFRTLTPRDFRTTQSYTENGFLHPNEVLDGQGSDYLMKVSAILGADDSIDEELYIDAMELINKAFDTPMPRDRFETTITTRMIHGKSTDDSGQVIWRWNKDWEKNSVTYQTKVGDILNIFYDYDRLLYYTIDLINEKSVYFDNPSKISQHINSVSIEPTSTKEMIHNMPNVLADTRPELDFGFYNNEAGRPCFNMFVSTTPYKIFKNPEEYADKYKPPLITMKFFETLIPDDTMRAYYLGFIKRKLDTFDYSPVILYFLGVQGSGKDTAVRILQRILGQNNFADPSARTFLENHNGWIVDKFFVQLNEFGDQMTSLKDKETAMGKLKSYTGSDNIQIRQMHRDGYQYDHKITFIMTSNKNPLMLDEDDRRIALFHTPTSLINTEWVAKAGGISSVIAQIELETNDFCYYLANSVPMISADEYNVPPASKDKSKLIADSMPVAKRIAFFMKSKNWVALRDIFDLYAPASLIESIRESRVYEQDLVEVYESMHGGDFDKPTRIIRIAMADMGFKQMRTTINNMPNVYYYAIPGLKEIELVPSAIPENYQQPELGEI